MSKLMISLLVLVTIGIGIYLFRGPLFQVVSERLTSDMFVVADKDSFDPGLDVGETFPGIKARHEGRTVTDISEFLGPNGLVFFANRSVDW